MIFTSQKHFAKYVQGLGGTLYLVGGAVRDIYMGKDSDDLDFTIEGLENLQGFNRVGKDFPVYRVEIDGKVCEVALCRTERKTDAGYNGFETDTKDVSIYEDLKRRDLTINSMAINVLTQELVDPFGGLLDIARKKLRATSKAFIEDPLRIVRVARFLARFPDFTLDEKLYSYMYHNRAKLVEIPGERIAKELRKMYEQTRTLGKRRSFFDILKSIRALEIIMPEIDALDVPDKHDGTAYNHVMELLDYGDTYQEFLGLLAHDLGKGMTDPSMHPSHHGHDKMGMDAARSLAQRLCMSKQEERLMIAASETHMNLKRFDEMRTAKKLRMAIQYSDIFETLIQISYLDSVHREGVDDTQFSDIFQHFLMVEITYGKIQEVIQIIDGKLLRRLGVQEGPNFGQRLEQERILALKKLSI